MCVHVKLQLVVYQSERLEGTEHLGLACCLDGTYFNCKTQLTWHIIKLKGYKRVRIMCVCISACCVSEQVIGLYQAFM